MKLKNLSRRKIRRKLGHLLKKKGSIRFHVPSIDIGYPFGTSYKTNSYAYLGILSTEFMNTLVHVLEGRIKGVPIGEMESL